MAANYVTFANGIFYEDFLSEQEQNRISFVYTEDVEFSDFLEQQAISRLEFAFNSRTEFLANVRQYFRGEHTISDELLRQRRVEVGF